MTIETVTTGSTLMDRAFNAGSAAYDADERLMCAMYDLSHVTEDETSVPVGHRPHMTARIIRHTDAMEIIRLATAYVFESMQEAGEPAPTI